MSLKLRKILRFFIKQLKYVIISSRCNLRYFKILESPFDKKSWTLLKANEWPLKETRNSSKIWPCRKSDSSTPNYFFVKYQWTHLRLWFLKRCKIPNFYYMFYIHVTWSFIFIIYLLYIYMYAICFLILLNISYFHIIWF